jgi:hypothetical protein
LEPDASVALASAKEFISNRIIRAIEKENSKSPSLFQDAIRSQIVFNAQRLRVTLAVLDSLMTVFNDSRKRAAT